MAIQTKAEREQETRIQYELVTDRLFNDRQAFKDFLSFSGKHYKLSANLAIFDKFLAAQFTELVSSQEGKDLSSISKCIDYYSDSQSYGKINELNKALNISEDKSKAFSKSVCTMIRAVVAARCSFNSKFNYKSEQLDLSALDMLHSKAEFLYPRLLSRKNA